MPSQNNGDQNTPSNGIDISLIKNTFAEFAEDLMENEIDESSEKFENFQGELEIKLNTQMMKEKDWEDAKSVNSEYICIKDEIAIKLSQTTSEFEGNLVAANDKFTELGTKLDASIACIKSTQKSFLDVISAIHNVENAIKDHCNTGEVEILENEIGLTSHIQILKDCAVEACNEAGGYFDEAAKAAGIKALLDLSNLLTFGTTLKTEVKEFADDVDEKVLSTTEYVATKRADLDLAIKASCKANDDVNTEGYILLGLEEVKALAKRNNRFRPTTMEHLIVEAEKNFELEKN